MDDRFNTIAGWVLFAGIVALGSSIVAGELFHAERPEKMGYPIAGVAQEGEGGAAAEQPIEVYLAKADPAKGQQVFNKCMACHNADKGGANQMGPNLWGVLGEPIGQGKGFAFSRRAREEGRHLELGQSQPVADQPARVRARHQDDLRRPQQSAGPRQRHRVPQCAQRCAQAASGRAGRGERRPASRRPATSRATARTTGRRRPARSRRLRSMPAANKTPQTSRRPGKRRDQKP